MKTAGDGSATGRAVFNTLHGDIIIIKCIYNNKQSDEHN
jgi:hypothetical protein